MEKITLQGLINLNVGDYQLVLPTEINTPLPNALATTALEEVYINCNTIGGEIAIILPPISSFNKNWQTKIYIINNTSIPVNIKAFNNETELNYINGNINWRIDIAYGSNYFHIVSDNNWMAL